MTLTMTPSPKLFASLVFLTVLFLGGCRTYGGHGSEAALREQISTTNRLFAESLQRHEADVQAISSLGGSDAALGSYAASLQAVLAAHRVTLEQHLALEEELRGSNDYRALSRAYGAIIAEEGLIKAQTEEILRAMAAAMDTAALRAVPLMSRYAYVPPFYERMIDEASTPTISGTIQRLGSASRLTSAPADPAMADSAAAPADAPRAATH